MGKEKIYLQVATDELICPYCEHMNPWDVTECRKCGKPLFW